MENNANCECACARCGHVMTYRSADAGRMVECLVCQTKSILPAPQAPCHDDLPPAPSTKTRNCEVCSNLLDSSSQVCPFCAQTDLFKKLKLRLTLGLSAAAALVVMALILWHSHSVAARELEKARQARHESITIIGARTATGASRANGFFASGFRIERNRESDTTLAVGDIENRFGTVRRNLRADMELLDHDGKRIRLISDYAIDLPPGQSWHVLVAVNDPAAASVRLLKITADTP